MLFANSKISFLSNDPCDIANNGFVTADHE